MASGAFYVEEEERRGRWWRLLTGRREGGELGLARGRGGGFKKAASSSGRQINLCQRGHAGCPAVRRRKKRHEQVLGWAEVGLKKDVATPFKN